MAVRHGSLDRGLCRPNVRLAFPTFRTLTRLSPMPAGSLQDLASPKKREAALCTLGQLASNSGYVITPYNEHPELLTILVNIVKNEPPGDLRRETIRLMGILGALDPYKHQQVIEESPESNLRAEAEAESDVTLIMRGITPSNDE